MRQAFHPASTWNAADAAGAEEAPSHKWQSLSLGAADTRNDDGHREPLLGAPVRSVHDTLVELVQRSFALLIMSVLITIESVPFGLAFFPASWDPFPVPRSLGIQMFLLSSAIAQAVFAASSRFEVASGLMMCENIPFMIEISTDVRAQLAAQGREDEALPTVLAAYALSTLVVGAGFFALGALRLGSTIGLIPPYIILGARARPRRVRVPARGGPRQPPPLPCGRYRAGCIGGIGVFIVQTGLEISTGQPFSWSFVSLAAFAKLPTLAMWLLPLGLSCGLRLLSRAVRTPLLTPLFFVCVPLAFHAALKALRIPLDTPSVQPWFFEAEPTPDWTLLWRVYARGQIAWDVLPSQLGTFAALTAFSLIHVPINVPSLSMTTNVVADIDTELRAHGVANLLSGLVGCLPNYIWCARRAFAHARLGAHRQQNSRVMSSPRLAARAATPTRRSTSSAAAAAAPSPRCSRLRSSAPSSPARAPSTCCRAAWRAPCCCTWEASSCMRPSSSPLAGWTASSSPQSCSSPSS